MTYSLSRLLFLGLLVVGFVLFVFQTPRDWPYFIAAVGIAALACAALAYGKWFEPNRIAAVLPPLAVVLAIALLREGQGGSLSGFWLVSYGSVGLHRGMNKTQNGTSACNDLSSRHAIVLVVQHGACRPICAS